MLSNWLSAIGSIGTALAALIALLALLQAINENKSRAISTEAAEIRRVLKQFAQDSQLLTDSLVDGSALIMGATGIAKEVKDRIGTNATAEDFWSYLDSNDSAEQSMVSVAVAGWNRSYLLQGFHSIRDSQRRSSNGFIGQLAILREASDMVSSLIKDSYSPTIFIKMLNRDAFSKGFRKRVGVKPLPIVLDAFANYLSGNAASYFILRYEVGTDKINEFIQDMAIFFQELSDSDLVRLSRTPDSSFSDTKTGTMRIMLEQLKDDMDPERYERLSTMVTEIEEAVSKKFEE